MSWSIMIGGDVGDGGDAAEREAAILAAVVDTVRGLGDEVSYASFTGVTTGAINVLDHAAAEPDHDSDSVSPEVKLAEKLAATEGPQPTAEQTAADKATTDTVGVGQTRTAGDAVPDNATGDGNPAPTI